MGKRILFLEDDAGFRRVFTHAIREALGDEGLGVAFVEAGSLAEARSRLRASVNRLATFHTWQLSE
jgi:hypothetical protein